MMEPQPPPPIAPEVPAPAYRLHSPTSCAWATFFGTPAAGSIVLALNYWKWGQKGVAAVTVVAGFLISGIIGWLAWITPASVPAAAFLLPQISRWILRRQIAPGPPLRRPRRRRRQDGLQLGRRRHRPGVLYLLIGAFAVWFPNSGVNPRALLDTQQSVDIGHGQEVFYSRGAARDDAQQFGEALVNADYFDDTAPAAV